jgi:hypothetical protein
MLRQSLPIAIINGTKEKRCADLLLQKLSWNFFIEDFGVHNIQLSKSAPDFYPGRRDYSKGARAVKKRKTFFFILKRRLEDGIITI